MSSSVADGAGIGAMAISRVERDASSASCGSCSRVIPISWSDAGTPITRLSATIEEMASPALPSSVAAVDPRAAPTAAIRSTTSGSDRQAWSTYGSSSPVPSPCGVLVNAPIGYCRACERCVPVAPKQTPASGLPARPPTSG